MDERSRDRLAKLWKLVEQDPDCVACQADLRQAWGILEDRTKDMTKDDSLEYWSLPTTVQTFYARILELACREMRFPEENG